MKKLYLLSTALLMTASIAFSMEKDWKGSFGGSLTMTGDQLGKKRPLPDDKSVFYDSDDEMPKPASHADFQARIQDYLDQKQLYSARCYLQDWIQFCDKNKDINVLQKHIPTLWAFCMKVQAKTPERVLSQKITVSALETLEELTTECGLNAKRYLKKLNPHNYGLNGNQ